MKPTASASPVKPPAQSAPLTSAISRDRLCSVSQRILFLHCELSDLRNLCINHELYPHHLELDAALFCIESAANSILEADRFFKRVNVIPAKPHPKA